MPLSCWASASRLYPIGVSGDSFRARSRDMVPRVGVEHAAFSAADCSLFARYPKGSKWADVTDSDKEAAQSLRERLKAVAATGSAALSDAVPAEEHVSLFNIMGN